MIKSLLKNQKGSISIIGIILTLIIVTVISGFVSINKNSWFTSELQSIIDISSLNALNNSIDSDKLRKEIFAVKGTNASIDSKTNVITKDSIRMNTVINKNFQTELNKQLKKNSIIESIKIRNSNSVLELSTWGINAYGENKARPQLVLDAMLEVVINNSEEYDNLGEYVQTYFDAKSGNTKVTLINGQEKDGKVVLLVRCLSRITYR